MGNFVGNLEQLVESPNVSKILGHGSRYSTSSSVCKTLVTLEFSTIAFLLKFNGEAEMILLSALHPLRHHGHPIASGKNRVHSSQPSYISYNFYLFYTIL